MSQSPWGSNNWGEQAWGDNGIDVSVAVDPWGSDAFGEGTWGNGDGTGALDTNTGSVTIDLGQLIIPTGQSLTTSTGQSTVTGDANVSVTGVSLTSVTGNEDAFSDVDINVTGISLTANTGTLSFEGTANIFPTGINLTSQTGTPEVRIAVGPILTGIEASTNIGSVTTQANADVDLTGINLTSEVGNVDPAPDVAVTGVEATVNVNSIVVDLNTPVDVTGIQLTTGLGDETAFTNVNVEVTNSAPLFQFTTEGNAQLSTAQAKFGSSSLLLDGTDDYVDTTTNLDLSSGDFTVDVWIRPDNVTGYKGIWQSGTSTTEQSYLLGNQVYWSVNPSTIITSSVTVNANEWTMLSYERQGNTHRIYKNGTLEDTATTGNKQDNGSFTIGKNGFGDFDGYIDEFRVSDIARYEGSSFTEPTSEFSVDSDTIALLHFNGANGSTDIINSVPNNAFAMTANEGTVDPSPDAEVTGIGFSASLAVGTVVIGEANVTVVGEGFAAGLGVGTLDAVTLVDLTGISLSANLGGVTVIGEGKVTLTGLGLTMAEGTNRTLIWNQVNTGTAPTWTEVDTAA